MGRPLRHIIAAFGAFCALSAPATADITHAPWRTGDFGKDSNRTGAITCTTNHPSVACMQVGCGPRGTSVLSFTDLGFVRDLQKTPAGKAQTRVVLRLPDGQAFDFAAERVAVKKTAYNQVEVRDWQNADLLAGLKALGKGSDDALITVTLPDGRESTFTSRTMNFATGQVSRLCAK